MIECSQCPRKSHKLTWVFPLQGFVVMTMEHADGMTLDPPHPSFETQSHGYSLVCAQRRMKKGAQRRMKKGWTYTLYNLMAGITDRGMMLLGSSALFSIMHESSYHKYQLWCKNFGYHQRYLSFIVGLMQVQQVLQGLLAQSPAGFSSVAQTTKKCKQESCEHF